LAKGKKSVIQAAGGIIWKEEDQQKKLAVVHRHKHNDWSLPKGKLEPGESWKNAALREVLEETGCIGKIQKYAGSISYILNGKPKVVLFWHMKIKGFSSDKMNGEVDEYPEAAFMMVGTIDDAIEKGKKLLSDSGN